MREDWKCLGSSDSRERKLAGRRLPAGWKLRSNINAVASAHGRKCDSAGSGSANKAYSKSALFGPRPADLSRLNAVRC